MDPAIQSKSDTRRRLTFAATICTSAMLFIACGSDSELTDATPVESVLEPAGSEVANGAAEYTGFLSEWFSEDFTGEEPDYRQWHMLDSEGRHISLEFDRGLRAAAHAAHGKCVQVSGAWGVGGRLYVKGLEVIEEC